MEYKIVEDAVATTGLLVRGGFHPGPEDKVPDVGGPFATLIVIGNAGPGMWRAFSQAPTPPNQPPDHPLDRWTRRVLDPVAKALGAVPFYPFFPAPDGGFTPFLRWAQRAENVFSSPMGPLIHPDYGLWHAYRGALAFRQKFDLPPRDTRPRPCDTCEAKPCLTTCPVGAFSGARYDVPACVTHIDSRAGADCLSAGCLARRACPVGRDYLYAPAQAGFHMQSFLKANYRHKRA